MGLIILANFSSVHVTKVLPNGHLELKLAAPRIHALNFGIRSF